MTSYDVVIVGAGPTGLMAAKRTAEIGLRVIVIERKKDVSRIRRACCSHFVMDEGYAGEALQVTEGKLVFPRNGFEVRYEGPTRTITDKYFNTPHRHTIRFSHQNGQPIGIKFDKGRLLQGLMEECEHLGVECMMGTVAYKAEDTPDKITVHTVRNGTKSSIAARKGIVADGANAHIPESLGMHKERKYYHTALAEKYIVGGVTGYKPLSWNFYFGRAFHSHAPVIIGPSLHGNDVVEATIMGSKNKLPAVIFEKVAADSPLTPLFKGAQVIDKHACSLRTFNALPIPYQGNVRKGVKSLFLTKEMNVLKFIHGETPKNTISRSLLPRYLSGK